MNVLNQARLFHNVTPAELFKTVRLHEQILYIWEGNVSKVITKDQYGLLVKGVKSFRFKKSAEVILSRFSPRDAKLLREGFPIVYPIQEFWKILSPEELRHGG